VLRLLYSGDIGTEKVLNLRVLVYALTAILSLATFFLVRGASWSMEAYEHTTMEVFASVVALIVGGMALVRYTARRETTFYYVGVGFLGAGLLDGFQSLITTDLFSQYSASDYPALMGWSWLAARQFLSLFLLLSWIEWLREERRGAPDRIRETTLLGFSAIFMAATVIALVLVPLPRANFPDLLLSRPVELIPAIFFVMTLIGYLYKGKWRFDTFEHWLVVSLILGFVAQILFMATSPSDFGAQFNVAHVFKQLSYVAALIGLILSMEMDSAARLRAVVNNIADGVITFDAGGKILSVNPAVRRMFGRLESELVTASMDDLLVASDQRDVLTELTTASSRRWRSQSSHVMDIEGVRLSGDRFPLALTLARLNFSTGPVYVAALRDVTEQIEMDRVKSEFIATVSHELRTPLTVILGYLPLLSDSEQMPEAKVVARLANNMKHSGEHLLALVSDLLDISRIESGRLSLQRVPLSIQNVIGSVTGIMDVQATDKELKIVTNIQNGIVHADETRLKQILINLVGNAIKFTEEGEIKIDASIGARGVTFTISDTGIGIPYNQLGSVFDRFRQVDGSHTRKAGGTGLGLAITRSLVELHGGSISVTSSFGNGSKFVFDIPEIT
jgi:PAS domain S-box-containing protein